MTCFEAMQLPTLQLEGTSDLPSFEPTEHRPGSAGKVAVLEKRARLGLPLWHPDDKCGPVCLHNPMLQRYTPPKGPHRLGWAFKGWKSLGEA